jgi:hypothetical protein
MRSGAGVADVEGLAARDGKAVCGVERAHYSGGAQRVIGEREAGQEGIDQRQLKRAAQVRRANDVESIGLTAYSRSADLDCQRGCGSLGIVAEN